MFKALFKKQMLELMSVSRTRKNKKSQAGKGIGVLYGVLLGVLAISFFTVGLGLSSALVPMGAEWLYFAIMGLIAIALGVFGSVFTTYSSLYLAKDNEFLIALPIPPMKILAARLFGVWIWGTVFEVVAFLPGLIAYWIIGGAAGRLTVPGVIGGIVTMILLSVFVLSLTCILGWVVAKVSVRLKNKSIVTVIIAVAFFALYYFVYFKVQRGLTNILTNAQAISDAIRGWALPVYWMGRGAAGEIPYLLLVTALVIAIGAAVCLVLSRTFIKLATATAGGAKKEYRERTAKRRSADKAMLDKELRRFTSSANYMLNCGLGILLLPALGVLAIVFRGKLLPMLSAVSAVGIGPEALACAVMCMAAAMNDITAPSISLEGKNLWLVQSLPLSPWTVLKAKLKVHGLLTGIPVLFCGVCLILALRPDPAGAVMMLTVPLAFTAMMGGLGLALNLNSPNFNWSHETVPIKQSLPVTVSIFGGWVAALVVLALGKLLSGWVGTVVLTALVGLAAWLILRWLKRRGAARFAAL